MINAGLCTCGHDRGEHDHGSLDCYRCECVDFKDQNDLDLELNEGGVDAA